MSKLLTLLLILLFTSVNSQRVIYTDNPKDKRLFAYRDSLQEYKDYVKYKDYILKRISTFKTFTQYDNFVDSIKQVEKVENFIESIKCKCDPTSSIKWELISSIESLNGIIERKLWIGKSYKPYVIVKFIPKPKDIPVTTIDTFIKSHVIYQTKSIDGKITIDSSKTFKKLVAIN